MTVVSDYYRDSIDEAVQAVQSGVEDYNTAIRRVVKEAATHGLRVREKDNAKVVDYESGYSRRLDSAARMNVLDGTRHLNQNILNAVGEEFGANGVEIDAHMLCADDHLPYQGKQYSKKEFEKIQDSLRRPFGEWYCRHTWHPIILGVSPRAYSDEELAEMQRYSNEKITIDGKTKTRYEWSQEQRRIETAIRQQKDTATLAKAGGDKTLADRSKANILRLNRYYDQVSEESGLRMRYDKTYVADSQQEKRLTSGVNDSTITTDSDDFWHAITDESILQERHFHEFDTPELNNAVGDACTKILTEMKSQSAGTEMAISIDASTLKTKQNKGEPGEGAVEIPRMEAPYIFVHNHPSNETFSSNDINAFAERLCTGIVAVGNDGRNIYTLIKTESFDRDGLLKYLLMRKLNITAFDSEEEFVRGVEAFVIRYSKRFN